jgi:hypothetical protein
MKSTPKKKILIFIVAYNAESHIKSVLDRIPRDFIKNKTYKIEILIIDDSSKDDTVRVSSKYIVENSELPITIFKNPVNQRYGGNQKIGYLYMLKKNFDIVVLLHGDGQYAPECIPSLIEPIIKNEADVVFGSRMINKKDALKGGMPLYKYFGNQILTAIQNKLLGSNLHEFHSGYRIYSRKVIEKIPFQFNSNDFDFDTDIIIQIIDNNFRIKELSIPTFYGNEVCNVNGIKYAKNILKSTILSRIQRRAQLFYNPKFDYNDIFYDKTNFFSSHKFVVDRVQSNSAVIYVEPDSTAVTRMLFEKLCIVYNMDGAINHDLINESKEKQELSPHLTKKDKLDTILLMDILEHVKDVDSFLLTLRNNFSSFNPEVIITSGNIAFFITRISLLFGTFRYGKRGILDKTNIRLYTFSSLKRLLRNTGYTVDEIKGIPAPFPLIFGKNKFSNFLLLLNILLIKVNKGLFSYQIAITAHMQPSLDLLLERSSLEVNKQ